MSKCHRTWCPTYRQSRRRRRGRQQSSSPISSGFPWPPIGSMVAVSGSLLPQRCCRANVAPALGGNSGRARMAQKAGKIAAALCSAIVCLRPRAGPSRARTRRRPQRDYAGRRIKRWPVAARTDCHRWARGSPREGLARIRPGAAAADRCRPSGHLAKMPLRPRLPDQNTGPGAVVLPSGRTPSP